MLRWLLSHTMGGREEMHFKSLTSLLGLPLVHVAIGPRADSSAVRGVAKGWIAIGDIAFGIVFAAGGLSVGGVSFGGLSVGVVALAGLSIGVWSVGGLAIGVFAVGGGAIAAWAAHGGLALATEYAVGGLAIGTQANTAAAQRYFESSTFFVLATQAVRYSRWLLLFAVIVPVLAVVRRRRSRPGA